MNDQFSIGAGLDFDRSIARIDATIGFPVGALGISGDSISKNNAYGWGYGGHIGLLYQMDQQTRFGLAYRSRISTHLTGFSTLTGPLVSNTTNSIQLRTFNATLVFPPMTTLSGYHDINSQWAVQGSVNYIQWSSIPSVLTLKNIAGLPPITPVVDSVLQNYSNTWYLAGGVNFKPTDRWLLRAALAFDQTPVKSTERNVLLPDGNRIETSLGAHYQASKYVGFDVGWTHVFIHDVSIDLTSALSTQRSRTTGSYRSHGDLVGAQAVVTFA